LQKGTLPAQTSASLAAARAQMRLPLHAAPPATLSTPSSSGSFPSSSSHVTDRLARRRAIDIRPHVAALVSSVSILLSSACPLLLAPPPSLATDGAKIGACLLTKAPVALARCVTNPVCATNLLCIQTCTGRPDEGECQIACGDKFAGPVVEDFTRAAVSEQGCVPQRQDDGSWPVPKSSALVDRFSTTDIEGSWYISAGLNKAFDTFDCQLHKFEAPSPTTLVGNLQWRIKDPIAGSNFVTRYTVQTFYQDEKSPGILYNHDNEFLHYQDDWYILAHKPNEYFVVYYRGSNDAWDGYGGAVVYSREPTLGEQFVPEIEQALARVGVRWADFTRTDNSCRAAETKLEEFEADLRFVETKVAGGIQVAENTIIQDVELGAELLKDETVALELEAERIERDVQTEVKRDLSTLFRFGR